LKTKISKHPVKTTRHQYPILTYTPPS